MTVTLFLPFHFLEVGSILRHNVFSCFPSGFHWLWGLTGKETACRTEADSAKSWSWPCGLTWAMSPSLYSQSGIKGWNALMASASLQAVPCWAWRAVSLPWIPKWKPGLWGNGSMSVGKQLTRAHSELLTGGRKWTAPLWSSFPLHNHNYLVFIFFSGSQYSIVTDISQLAWIHGWETFLSDKSVRRPCVRDVYYISFFYELEYL